MASSRMIALLGLLAVAGYQNRDRLGEMLKNVTGPNGLNLDRRRTGLVEGGGTHAASSSVTPGGNSWWDQLGNVFADGYPGEGIRRGLSDLVDRFSSSGRDNEAESWVKDGLNRPIGTGRLEEVLGEDTVTALSAQTGLSREELLSRLSSVLPTAVDQLTPDGKLPDPPPSAGANENPSSGSFRGV